MKRCHPSHRHIVARCGAAACVDLADAAKAAAAEEGNSDDAAVTLHTPFADVSRLHVGAPEEAVRRISLFYRPEVHAYGLLSAAVILDEAYRRGILERRVDPAKFLVHPMALIRNPSMFSQFFGADRAPLFSDLLCDLLAQHDAAQSPLVLACRSQSVNAGRWIPFLRGLSLCVAASDPVASQATTVIEDLLLGGGGGGGTHNSLAVPGDYHDRGVSVADMLMEAAVEFGLISLSLLSLSVYRQFLPETPYAVSKRFALCTTRSERRQLDWNVRCLAARRRRR
ncbi:hypothetical protein DQ04_06931010 [Trypanosoma grayi]|uniref:hypothetical protein n=1 Tax=Trypanosoma grayi TaxID=71804 RepID=UPI0004F3EFBC|nr:hypothetical protein DQ04_06931010 [Trypanosoma grayi]KEG08549.1 hypothetical protein DQ04_06931010 [Trypanosoma grayi]